jgi:hypothetical protein
MKRVLVFSPYAIWTIHTIYEKAIALACQVRGAEVDYLLCDGLLPECDQHWDSKEKSPRPFDLCERCQGEARRNMHESGFAHSWLGQFVSTGEASAAFSWAQSLAPEEFRSASFGDLPIGQWIQASVISYFRQYPPDLKNWHVASVFRGCLYSGAIVSIGLRNYLRANQVDAAILFNGRQSITRVAMEIFRLFGVRVLTHERAEYCRGHINVKPNSHCMSLDRFSELWTQWTEVALDRPALDAAYKWLVERKTGTNLAWIPFNNFSEPKTSVRTKLNLNIDKPLWVLFTSSTDETSGDPDMRGPFESQYVWMRDVVQWVSTHPEIQLIIKIHPNLGGNVYIGKATDELRVYEEMKATLPDNVKLVFPEDAVNAYILAEEAEVGLTFGSIIGLEMAMLGKPVLLAARAYYESCSAVLRVKSRESLPEMLEQCLHASASREIQRETFRLAYCYIRKFEMEFPAIRVLGIYDAEANYHQAEDLGPGKDATLDRICNFLLEESPLYELPTAQDFARSTQDEDTFFEELASGEYDAKDGTPGELVGVAERNSGPGRLLRGLFSATRIVRRGR